MQLVKHQFSIPSSDLNGLVAWQDVTFDVIFGVKVVKVEISLGLGRFEISVGMGLSSRKYVLIRNSFRGERKLAPNHVDFTL